MSACVELRRAQPWLGTMVEVAAAAAGRAAGDAAIDAAFAAVARVHRLMSFHAPDSDLSRVNRGEAPDLDPWTAAVLAAAEEFRGASGGAFDVGIAGWLQARGVLPGEPPPIRHRHAPGRLDLGGIAKGFAVDRAVEALRAHGIRGGLVNAGGDLAVFGPAPRPVDLRDPRRPGAVLGRILVRDRALAASAPAQPGAAPSVIVEPATGKAAGARGAFVLARDCLTADALTKIVMLQGRNAAPLLARYGAEALLVDAGGLVHATADWPEPIQHAA